MKCWDSHKIVKLELDFLKDHYAILSLSTGLFKLDQNKEKIVVAIVGDVKGDKNDDIEQSVASGASQHDKMINFYRNEHFGTDSLMKTKSVGSMINTINLNAELNTNIVPYRLSQRKLTPKLNSFILLTNQGKIFYLTHLQCFRLHANYSPGARECISNYERIMYGKICTRVCRPLPILCSTCS